MDKGGSGDDKGGGRKLKSPRRGNNQAELGSSHGGRTTPASVGVSKLQKFEKRREMTTTVLTRGSEWSASTLHDGWGDVTDTQVKQLSCLVCSRFEELAKDAGYLVSWFPFISEVRGDVDLNAHDDTEGCVLDDIREQATQDVWEAVIGNGGPMEEAVKQIFDN